MTLECISERAFAHKHGDEAVLPKPQDPVYDRAVPTVRDFPPDHPVVYRAKAELVDLRRDIEHRERKLQEQREKLSDDEELLAKIRRHADYLTTFLEPKP